MAAAMLVWQGCLSLSAAAAVEIGWSADRKDILMTPGDEAQVHARVFQALLARLPPDCTGAELEVRLSCNASGQAQVTCQEFRQKCPTPDALPLTTELVEAIERLRMYYEQKKPQWEIARYKVSAGSQGRWAQEVETIAIICTGGGGEED
jgi:hypothetical protein